MATRPMCSRSGARSLPAEEADRLGAEVEVSVDRDGDTGTHLFTHTYTFGIDLGSGDSGYELTITREYDFL